MFDEVDEALIKKRGRKRIKGNKQPTLKQLIGSDKLDWNEQKIMWYAQELKKVKIATGVSLWYKSGEKPLKIRWVLVFSPDTNKTEAFFSTDTQLIPQTIVEYFILRWNIEVTFEEARANLGIETQRQWSENAIKRTTPVLFGLYSFVCLIAYEHTKQNNSTIETHSTAWYNKQGNATFSDVLIHVKRLILLNKTNFYKSNCNDEFVKIHKQDLEILINNGLMAA